MKLSEKALKERAKILADMVAIVGAEKVETYLADPVKLATINALAAAFAKGA